ncbi:hypothetical protein [Halobaculum sp. D14]|uniref:hypothetical protein n=1 Tax=Halobaculum sp. D14 TaxID=3421642 RepID=UPI003EC0619B
MPSDELEGEDQQRITAASMSTDTVNIDAEAYENIRLVYEGQTYRVVRTDDGLELEVVDGVE